MNSLLLATALVVSVGAPATASVYVVPGLPGAGATNIVTSLESAAVPDEAAAAYLMIAKGAGAPGAGGYGASGGASSGAGGYGASTASGAGGYGSSSGGGAGGYTGSSSSTGTNFGAGGSKKSGSSSPASKSATDSRGEGGFKGSGEGGFRGSTGNAGYQDQSVPNEPRTLPTAPPTSPANSIPMGSRGGY